MALDEKKLDNPVWFSLSETHQKYAINSDTIKFYHPDYCPFGGFIKLENTAHPIAEYAKLAGSFYIVGQKPILPNHLKLKDELVCHQMIIYKKIVGEKRDDGGYGVRFLRGKPLGVRMGLIAESLHCCQNFCAGPRRNARVIVQASGNCSNSNACFSGKVVDRYAHGGNRNGIVRARFGSAST